MYEVYMGSFILQTKQIRLIPKNKYDDFNRAHTETNYLCVCQTSAIKGRMQYT